MADTSWLALGAAVGYGGLATYAVALAVRIRRARRAMGRLRGEQP